MLTIDSLRAWGADTNTGLNRCMNNEAFYLRLVDKGIRDEGFIRLKESVEAGDLARGFEEAHALKGVMANLALDPVTKPVTEITELLRACTDTDYSALLEKILAERDSLIRLL